MAYFVHSKYNYNYHQNWGRRGRERMIFICSDVKVFRYKMEMCACFGSPNSTNSLSDFHL